MRFAEILEAKLSKDEFHKRLVNPKRNLLLNQIEEFKKEVEDDYDFTVTYTDEELAGDHYFEMKATPNEELPADSMHDDFQKVLTAYYALFVVNHFETENGYTFLQREEGHRLHWNLYYD